MNEAMINKVAESGLMTLDLENYYPDQEIAVFDLKDYLFMGLVLKEKDFREALKAIDWSRFKGKYAAITCTADAIIPAWAYMLAASYLQPVSNDVMVGSEAEVRNGIFLKNIRALDLTPYTDQRVVVKGCGEKPIGESAYAEITKLLRPIAKTIMYGEPCSTVPIYKKRP